MKLYARKNKKLVKEDIADINEAISKMKEYLENGYSVRLVFYE